ncbi:MAG: type III glutamate--ammonia ligase [Deltaproteobacteria bacterium]|nr:type III glutamate--ammonia ligase [Deltaproteobacteria bacterium]
MTTLFDIAQDRGIRYFMLSFTDLLGVQRAKLVPASHINKMASGAAGFAGFATWLDMTPADADMFAVGDSQSLIQLPWKPEVAWLAADLTMNGHAVEQTPRVVLKRQLTRAKELGLAIRTGVECEFFVLSADGNEPCDASDRQRKPCYDQQSLMRRFDLVTQVSDAMQKLGWDPYQSDHEDGNGQFEMNWTYSDALVTADRHAFFKYMVKTLAEQQGLRATFMPKPFAKAAGNGCHVHVSAWDVDADRNLFHDPRGELGLSGLAYQFLGGVLANAEALCALTNSTVNSYKRINAPVTSSGATWAPNVISYAGNNRTHMVRIPDNDRFELRLADGAANPYLLQAGIIAAGIDGVEQELSPGPRRDNNMYTDPLPPTVARRLPANLLDALRALRANPRLTKKLGSEFVDAFIKLKEQEWNEHNAHISVWERQVTLDC